MKNRYKLITAFTVLVSIVTINSGCGTDADSDIPVDISDSVEVDTLIISIADTIGVEMGDNSYVFGMLMEVGHGTDGNIIALDMNRSCLSIYSPEGSFIGYIGSPGPGPGEFLIPIDFAVMSDGGVAVSDAVARNISFFDAEYAFQKILDDFFPTPPLSIEGCPDGGFVGQSMAMVMTGETMEASLQVCKYTDSTEADITYFSKPLELDFSGGSQAQIQRGPEIDFAVGPDGSVFVAELSDTLFAVSGYSPDGEEFLTLYEERERTPLTQEEIDAGSLSLSISIMNGEASAGMDRVENTYPWRNVIASIGVDAEKRIWVEMASTDVPLFMVYDYSGNLLFVAVTDVEFTAVTRPSFVIDAGGILACDRDPMDYPKIYSFQL
ncbi:MAG: 6-bladed beta-propeller, partial [Candidatus Aegiribacteria sp.]|nr:6-bladed beta-propeller [Candidatus Aegiribacteria sp.]